jgi:hypothetical protein
MNLCDAAWKYFLLPGKRRRQGKAGLLRRVCLPGVRESTGAEAERGAEHLTWWRSGSPVPEGGASRRHTWRVEHPLPHANRDDSDSTLQF